MIKKNKIPTLLGIVILLIATFAGVFFLRMNQVFKIGANPVDAPKDVRVSNITDSSATISWITEGQTVDFISWGESQGSLNNVINESDTGQKYFTHAVTITGLNAETSYFYKINSEGNTFDNNGVPWQITTGTTLGASQSTIPVSGSVITASGQPVKRAIVYVTVNGYVLSTTTSDSGNFVLQLGSARTEDLKNFATINPTQTLLTVSVEAEAGQTASAQIFPNSANPIPPLILGQVKDFRNLQVVNDNQNPNANLSLPTNATEESKFDTSSGSGSKKPTSVILESVDEGEVVTSTQPQFFGKGPSGEKITITVHSETPITQSVTIPSSGSWSWSPPTGLAEGAHTITISWIDATGITRTLTRNFVVQAGELPSFVASPSGSTPTGTPRVTPTPTVTPRPTATPTATPTKIATGTATPASIPATGDLTPTILLSIMGVAVMLFSFSVWKMSEN